MHITSGSPDGLGKDVSMSEGARAFELEAFEMEGSGCSGGGGSGGE